MTSDKEVVLCPTKAGKGFKVVHNGTWFYTSIGEVLKVIAGKSNAAVFRTREIKTLEEMKERVKKEMDEIERQREAKESQTELAVTPAESVGVPESVVDAAVEAHMKAKTRYADPVMMHEPRGVM